MVNTSADYKTAIAAPDREMRGYVEFNSDSTKIMRGCDGLVSIVTTAQIADEERPMFGCGCANICEVVFYNSGLPSGVSLANSYFDAYVGIVLEDTGTAPSGSIEPDTKTVEYVFMGRYFIDTIDRADFSTKITGYDDNSKLAKTYECHVTKTENGYPINQIIGDIRVQCGTIAQTTPTTDMGYVPDIYECTCRQMMGWILSVYSPGSNYMASRQTVGSINFTTVHAAMAYKDSPGHLITDETTYMGGIADSPEFIFNSVVTGTSDNPIAVGTGTGIVGENPYYDTALATRLYDHINGISFTPMTIEWRGDPAIVQGDVMKVVSGENTYYTYVQRIVSTFNGGFKQTFECYGDSEYHYGLSASPTGTKIQTAVSNLAQEIQQSIETANNGVITKVLDADGSWKELVIANSVDLSSATSVWRWNINGLSHSNRYTGGTYTFAMDDQGRIVANVIQTGVLQDALGKNSWNLDTGAFTITDGSVNITTATDSTDAIELNYGTAKIRLNPSRLDLSNTNGLFGNYAIVLRSDMGMIGVYDAVNTSTTFFNMTAHTGTLTLRGATSPGAIDLKDTNNNNTVILSGGNGFGGISKVGLVMGDGTHRLTDLDNTGLTFYDSSGTQTASYPANGMPSYDTGTVPCAVSTGWTLAGELTIQEDGVYAIYGLQNYNNAQPVATAIAGYNGTYEYSLASNADMERHGGIVVAHLNASCIEACWVGYKLRLYVKANQSATNNCRLYARKLA